MMKIQVENKAFIEQLQQMAGEGHEIEDRMVQHCLDKIVGIVKGDARTLDEDSPDCTGTLSQQELLAIRSFIRYCENRGTGFERKLKYTLLNYAANRKNEVRADSIEAFVDEYVAAHKYSLKPPEYQETFLRNLQRSYHRYGYCALCPCASTTGRPVAWFGRRKDDA